MFVSLCVLLIAPVNQAGCTASAKTRAKLKSADDAPAPPPTSHAVTQRSASEGLRACASACSHPAVRR